MNNTVSIITPAHNAETFLEKCIYSVRNQTYPHWEHLLIIDVKSRDETLNIAKKFESLDPRIKVIQNPLGNCVANNRNIGIQLAKGNYIAFLDADDFWNPNKLEVQTQFMLSNDSQFSFHDFMTFQTSSNQNHFKNKVRSCKKDITYKDLLKNNVIGCSTVMIKKELLNRYQFKKAHHEDYLLWLSLLKDGFIAHHIPEILSNYKIHPESLSGNKIKSVIWRWEAYKSQNLPLGEKVYYFSQYLISALNKRL